MERTPLVSDSKRVILRRFELKVRGRVDVDIPRLRWDHLDPCRGQDHNLAIVTCSQGHLLRLTSEGHWIGTDGTVMPSLRCTRAGCTFHEHIRLDGWRPGDSRGTRLVAIAVENLLTGQTGIFHTRAGSAADVRAAAAGVRASLPRGTRIAAIGEAIGFHEDGNGGLVT